MNPLELLQLWLDGECTPEQQAELQRWLRESPENVRTFVREVHAHRLLREFAVADQLQVGLAPADSVPVAKASRLAPRSTRRVWLAASIAACVLVAAGGMWWKRSAAHQGPGGSPTETATLINTEGSVLIHRGTQDIAAHAGTALLPQDTVRVPAQGSVDIRYLDQTRISLQGGTDVVIQPAQTPPGLNAGSAISLLKGHLKAQVSKQPAGKPFVFFSSQAAALVLGTVLEFKLESDCTRLDVIEGRVRFSRLDLSSKATAVDVPAGGYALAAGATTYSSQSPNADVQETARTLDDFESQGDQLAWKQYIETSPVEFSRSNQRAHAGKYSLRVAYRFDASTPDPYTELFRELSLEKNDGAVRFFIFVETAAPGAGWNIQFRTRDQSCWMMAEGDFADLSPGWNCIEIDTRKQPLSQTFGQSSYDATKADGLLFSVCRGSATFYLDDLLIISGGHGQR